MNSLVLVAVCPETVTLISPVDAPLGTLTKSCVVVADVTAAIVPLNFTVSFEGNTLKLVPTILTVVPTTPDAGEKLEMVGAAAIAAPENPTRQSINRLPFIKERLERLVSTKLFFICHQKVVASVCLNHDCFDNVRGNHIFEYAPILNIQRQKLIPVNFHSCVCVMN